MNRIQRTWSALMTGIYAFNVALSSSQVTNAAVFESYGSRSFRYARNWAFFEGTQFDTLVNSWVSGEKNQRGWYKSIRNISNPTKQLADFYTQAIWRGSLDPEAKQEGAIPYAVGEGVDDKKLRAAIALINKWSNWDQNKDVFVLDGTVMGDAVIYVRSDTERGQVRKEVIHPSWLKDCEFDNMGNVKSYVIEYKRVDNAGNEATYTETCRHGEAENEIIFETFHNNAPYAWSDSLIDYIDESGQPQKSALDSWVIYTGFVPLVVCQHQKVGLKWGWSEMHTDTDLVIEMNDQWSVINDVVRKNNNPIWLANFARKAANVILQGATPTVDNPEPWREELNTIYVTQAAGAPAPDMKALVAALNIADALANIKMLLDELRDRLPELRSEVWAGGSGPSDSTILAARGRVEGKVAKRRAGYDAAECAATKMAITIAGMNGLKGFESYGIDSYEKGEIDFSIAPRPAFPPQPSEILAEQSAFWAGYQPFVGTPVTFQMYARSLGKSDEWIAEIMREMSAEELAQKTAVTL
jgi:hypothetical protein